MNGSMRPKVRKNLADKFKEALSVIPGIEYEFTQPIEMRFNELITGVRSDIAIKIFGDDLDYISQKAIEIKNLVSLSSRSRRCHSGKNCRSSTDENTIQSK